MRIGPIHLDMMIAVFAVPKGYHSSSYGDDDALLIGRVQEKRRVTLFGDVAHYVGKNIIIRVRGKSEVTGNHVMPFETTIDGDKVAQAVYEKHELGGVGTIVRCQIQEDFLTEEEKKQHQLHGAIVDAATGVTVDDYAALGKFIIEFRSRRH